MLRHRLWNVGSTMQQQRKGRDWDANIDWELWNNSNGPRKKRRVTELENRANDIFTAEWKVKRKPCHRHTSTALYWSDLRSVIYPRSVFKFACKNVSALSCEVHHNLFFIFLQGEGCTSINSFKSKWQFSYFSVKSNAPLPPPPGKFFCFFCLGMQNIHLHFSSVPNHWSMNPCLPLFGWPCSSQRHIYAILNVTMSEAASFWSAYQGLSGKEWMKAATTIKFASKIHHGCIKCENYFLKKKKIMKRTSVASTVLVLCCLNVSKVDFFKCKFMHAF